ncbi:MAG TPA: hypothetical protein VFC74_06930 [Oscillospiraceae bacterium]|nr:hypothetical protein [Oscillospiraceae bacterium]
MDLRVNKRQLLLIGVDALLLTAAAYFGLLLQFNFQFTTFYLAQLNAQIFLIVPLCLLTFFLCGLYRPLWRYASIHELLLVVAAVTSSDLLIYLYLELFLATPLPTSFYIIKWILNLGLIGGSRMLMRILPTRFQYFHSAESRVLIIGAGAAGIMVAKEIQ